MRALIVFGDSIVWGRGEQPSLGWVGRLKEDFEKKDPYNAVYNLGIPGNTSSQLLKRIAVELESRVQRLREGDEFIILIGIGINDLRSEQKDNNAKEYINSFKKNLLLLANISNEFSKKVIFIGLTPVDEEKTTPYEGLYYTNKQIRIFDEIVKKTAKATNNEYINVYDGLVKEELSKILVDGIHLTTKGYEKMHQIIKKELEKKHII